MTHTAVTVTTDLEKYANKGTDATKKQYPMYPCLMPHELPDGRQIIGGGFWVSS